MKKFIAALILVTATFIVSSEASCWSLVGDCVVSEVVDFGDGSCGTTCGTCIIEDCPPGDPQA